MENVGDILDVFNNNTTLLNIVDLDIKKLLISYILVNPLLASKIIDECENNNINSLICENKQLLEFLWLRCISNKLPKELPKKLLKKYLNNPKNNIKNNIKNDENYKDLNLNQLKILYKGAILIYKKYTCGDIVKDYSSHKYKIIPKEYNIIYENSKIIENIYNLFQMENTLESSMLEKLVYIDQLIINNNLEGEKTLLMCLVMQDNISQAKILLKYGADINYQTTKGTTTLMISVQKSHNPNTITDLINLGAKIDIQDNNGFTALMYAILYKNLNAVKILLFNNANISLTNKYNESALSIAIKNNLKSLIPLLKHK